MFDKPVFISGISGGIGKVLALELAKHGATVRGISRKPEQTAAFFTNTPQISIDYGDITKPETLRGLLEGCGVVYHSAGYLSGRRELYHPINVHGTRNMLDVALQSNVERFVHVSSIVVYGRHDTFTEDIDETHSVNVTNAFPYMQTKGEADLLAQTYFDKLPLVIARPGEVYGPHQTVWTDLMIRLAKWFMLHPPTKRNTGMVNLIYGENLADALILLGKHPDAAGQIYNIVDGEPLSTHVYFKYLISLAKRPIIPLPRAVLQTAVIMLAAGMRTFDKDTLVTVDAFEFFFSNMTISGEKIRKELGWVPLYSRSDAFAQTETWLRSEGLIE